MKTPREFYLETLNGTAGWIFAIEARDAEHAADAKAREEAMQATIKQLGDDLDAQLDEVAEGDRIIANQGDEIRALTAERDRLKGELAAAIGSMEGHEATALRLQRELNAAKGELAEARRFAVERGDKITLAVDFIQQTADGAAGPTEARAFLDDFLAAASPAESTLTAHDLEICARPKCRSPRYYNIHDPERGGHVFVEPAESTGALEQCRNCTTECPRWRAGKCNKPAATPDSTVKAESTGAPEPCTCASVEGGRDPWCKAPHPAAPPDDIGARPIEQHVHCRGCGHVLRANRRNVADGCICNSGRGINHGIVPRETCTCTICDPAQTGSARPKDTSVAKPAAPQEQAVTIPRCPSCTAHMVVTGDGPTCVNPRCCKPQEQAGHEFKCASSCYPSHSCNYFCICVNCDKLANHCTGARP